MAKPVRKQLQLLTVLAVLVILALGARHYLQPKRPQAAVAPARVNPLADLPIMNVSVIVDSTDRGSLVGNRVQLAGVEVQKREGGGAFWIGRFGETLLIVSTPDTDVKAGQRVDVTGRVQPSYRLEPEWLQQNLGVTDTDALRHFGVYIEAEKVTVRQ